MRKGRAGRLTNLRVLLTALLLLAGVIFTPATAAKVTKSSVPSEVKAIESDAAFASLARTARAGRHMELPQVMFAIDRTGKPPRVHWINTRRYGWHFAFLQSRYLTLSESYEFSEANYSKPDRRFILGSVVKYPRLGRYGVEMWEGDIVEPELLTTMMERLQASFHAPLTFKPNSEHQRQMAEQAKLPVISAEEAYGSRDQLVLNSGRAVGRLVIVPENGEDSLLPGDIALLSGAPIRLPPVAGIVSTTFTTPINHVNLLAKSWGIPNAYKSGADKTWADLEGKQVVLDTRGASVIVRPATATEVRTAERSRAARAVRVPAADLKYAGLPSLAEQDRSWSKMTGAKAANLAQVAALSRASPESTFDVPVGFSVPFSFYDRFVAANDLGPHIAALLADPKRDDPQHRAPLLAALRERFAGGRIPPEDFQSIKAKRLELLGDGGAFVRSSTNAEDLPGFNGAGLYDTIPNVRGDEALEQAIKKVWGSLWNDRAFAARQAAGIGHKAVRAACLIQLGVDAEAAGVMTTIDPFDERDDEKRVFIAAKRGLGIRVVEGKRIAEQLIYRPSLDSIQLLTRSEDDTMLKFAPDGGVVEVTIDPRRSVLSDDLVRRLSNIGIAIEKRFGGKPQDIEWLIVGGRIMIVQSRDYVRGN